MNMNIRHASYALAAIALLGVSTSAYAFVPTAIATPETGVTLVDTPVDQMPEQSAFAYMTSIQEELAAHGYRAGPVDGVMGPQTRAAIRDYQRDAGLPITGIATKELLEHLKFAQPKVFASSSSAGAYIDPMLVRDVQIELAERGYYHGELDGIAGKGTRQAVRDFQNDAGLGVTGTINDQLLTELRDASPDVRASSSI